MSTWKKLIFKEEISENKKTDKETTQKQPTPPQYTPPAFTPQSSFATQQQQTFTPSAVLDVQYEEYMQVINKAFEARNIPGPDYYEFSKALEMFKTLPMDEPTKFFSAFAGLKAQGLTTERLIETAKWYVGKIEELKKSFDLEIDTRIKTEVGAKQKQVESLTAKNSQIETEMQKLVDLRNKNAEEIHTLSIEVNTELTNYNSKKAGFEGAVKIFNDNINKHIQNIEKHLTNKN
jgi:hypothetical protein